MLFFKLFLFPDIRLKWKWFSSSKLPFSKLEYLRDATPNIGKVSVKNIFRVLQGLGVQFDNKKDSNLWQHSRYCEISTDNFGVATFVDKYDIIISNIYISVWQTYIYYKIAQLWHMPRHRPSCHSQEQRQLLSGLRATFEWPLSRNTLRLILPLVPFSLPPRPYKVHSLSLLTQIRRD